MNINHGFVTLQIQNGEGREIQATSSTKKNSNKENISKKDNSEKETSKKEILKTAETAKRTSAENNSNNKATYAGKNNATTEQILQNLEADKKVNSCLRVTTRPLMVHICLMLHCIWLLLG